MEVKPTGIYSQPPSEVEDRGNTSAAAPAPDGRGIDAPTTGMLAKLSAEFRKADLQDPAKVDQMMSACANDMLASALDRLHLPASAADRSNLLAWLQNDPCLRGRVLSYLERVLPQ